MLQQRESTAATQIRRWVYLGEMLCVIVFSGCGGGAATQIPPPPRPDFAIAFSPSSINIAQGTTSSGVQMTIQALNGFDGTVQVTLSGIPAGVTANPANPFSAQTGTSTTVLLGISAAAAPGVTTISALGVSGSLSHTATLTLTVQNGVAGAISRSTFTRTDAIAAMDDPAGEPHHRHIAYDAVNHHLFIANRAENRVEVLSARDGSRVVSLDVAGASSADLSIDGKTAWVGTATNRIIGIDTGTLQQTSIFQVPALAPVPNTVFDRPEEVVALSGGGLMVRLRQAGGTETLLGLFNPTANSMINLTGAAPQVFQSGAGVMAPSGDRTRVLVVANDSSGAVAVFDGNGNVAVGPKVIGSGAILYASSDRNGSQFAAVSAGNEEQVLLLDSNLNLVQTRATNLARGVVFSRDGTAVYLAETQNGNAVLTALAAADLHLLGQAQDLNIQGVASEIEEVDETALVFALSNRGVGVVDAANLGAIASTLPTVANAPAVSPAGGPNVGGTTISLNGQAFGANPAVRFGAQAAANVGEATATQVQATSPANANSGAMNVSVFFADGSMALAPDAFSYGPQVLEVLPSAGNSAGGDAVAIYGYGFGEDASKIAVAFGSTSGTVQKVEDVSALSASLGLDATYPFPLQRITVNSPAGTAGIADIAVSAPSGKVTGGAAFQYLQSQQVFAKAGFYKFVAYDKKRQWIYLSNIDRVDVFDLAAGQFRAGILPPGGPPPDALIRQAALTPDASQLAIADFGAQSVYLMDPDTATGSTVKVGVIPGFPNSGPVRLTTTSDGTVFVGLAEYGASSAGCSACLQQMNLSASPISSEPAPQPQISALTSSPLMQSSGDGSSVFFSFAAAPGSPMATWSATAPQQFVTSQTNIAANDVAAAADGTFFAARTEGAVEIRDQSLRLQSVTSPAELEGIPQRTEVPGIALHPSGALVYVPFLTGSAPVSAPFTGLQGGVDVFDANTGRLRRRIILPEPFAMLAGDADGLHGDFLAIDENGQRLFALTASGLTVVQLATVPLGFGTISSPGGLTSGATATIRGSGFQPGATVTVGGSASTVSFVDMNTLKITLPALTSGPQSVTIANPDGERVSIDAAFNVN